MSTHGKKIAGAVICAAFTVALFLSYPFILSLIEELPDLIRYFLSAVYILMAAGTVYVLIERIREIKGGEEDDLDNY